MKTKKAKQGSFNQVVIPLRAMKGGRIVGFIYYTRSQDLQAHWNHRKVKVTMILRGRYETRSDFIARAQSIKV